MPTIVFVNEGKAGLVADGTTILQAALDLGVRISHVCGGNGTCSTCRVETSLLATFRDEIKTPDLGGSAGTREFAKAVAERLG